MDTDNSLLNHVVNLSKRTSLAKASRTEPTTQVSEFNLVKSGTKKDVLLQELTDTLKKRDKHAGVREKINNLKKRIKPLPKPLEKPKSDRIRRSIAFDKVKEQLDRYDAIVSSNRADNYLTFPSSNDLEIETGKDFSGFRLKSDLQKRLERFDEKPKVEVYNLEKKKQYSLTMDEMLAQRKEMARMKIIESYKAAKARRQNKIKSKKYHRIQRREKVKNQIKDFEQLQKTNPEEALKKLDEIERGRAEERASLRHRSTGKWARSKQVKAKYDSTNRQELAEQLAISHELTQKLRVNKDSESESDTEPMEVVKKGDENNPWVNSIKTSDEVDSFISGYRKFWDDNNAKKATEENVEKEVENVNEEDENTEEKTIAVTKPKKRKNKKKNVIRCVATSEWAVSVLSDTDEDENVEIVPANKKPKGTRATNEDLDQIFKKSAKTVLKEVANPKRKKESGKVKKKKQTQFEKLSFRKESNRPVLDEPLNETNTTSDENADPLKKVLSLIAEPQTDSRKSKSKENDIDPNDIISTNAVSLQTELPDVAIEDEGNDNDQYDIIAEAFQDDDIVEDFRKEKKDEVEGDKPEDVNLFLPGWGSWGGPGIKSTPKKRANKRFIIKFPKESKRRDENKGNLIINENSDDKIKSHLVSEVPFPFKTVKDFEASVRAPIGNTFVPETAFRKMIRPAVKTKMGAVIKPMSEDILLKTKR